MRHGLLLAGARAFVALICAAAVIWFFNQATLPSAEDASFTLSQQCGLLALSATAFGFLYWVATREW